MPTYTKTTTFDTKDDLITGNPTKLVKGTDLNVEFKAIEAALKLAPDSRNPTFTGTVTFDHMTVTFNGGVGGTTTTLDLVVRDTAEMGNFTVNSDVSLETLTLNGTSDYLAITDLQACCTNVTNSNIDTSTTIDNQTLELIDIQERIDLVNQIYTESPIILPAAESRPECEDHDCNAYLGPAPNGMHGKGGGKYSILEYTSNTDTLRIPGTAIIKDVFGNPTNLRNVDGSRIDEPNPASTYFDVSVSRICNDPTNILCGNQFRALQTPSTGVCGATDKIQSKFATKWACTFVPGMVDFGQGIFSATDLRGSEFGLEWHLPWDGPFTPEEDSIARSSGSVAIRFDAVTNACGIRTYGLAGGNDYTYVTLPPTIGGMYVFHFEADITVEMVGTDAIGYPEYVGNVVKVGAVGSVWCNGKLLLDGFRAMYKSGYNPDDFEYYVYYVGYFLNGMDTAQAEDQRPNFAARHSGANGSFEPVLMYLNVDQNESLAASWTPELYSMLRSGTAWTQPAYCNRIP